jgi:hypothetical protein
MENNNIDKPAESQRTEARITAEEYESVEFKISKSNVLQRFKLLDVSEKGLCFVAHEDSVVIKELMVGDILNMKYYPADASKGAEYLTTEIRHVTKTDKEGYEGQSLVGLIIFDKKEGSIIMSPS